MIRDATEIDLPAIVAIYNATIPGRMATADTQPVTVVSRRDWFHEHNPSARGPLWAALENNVIAGWRKLSTWSDGPPRVSSHRRVEHLRRPNLAPQGNWQRTTRPSGRNTRRDWA